MQLLGCHEAVGVTHKLAPTVTCASDCWRPILESLRDTQGSANSVASGDIPTHIPLSICSYPTVQVGDASGIQSPLSFGGFGALTRHLRRLTDAVSEAVQVCRCLPGSHILRSCFASRKFRNSITVLRHWSDAIIHDFIARKAAGLMAPSQRCLIGTHELQKFTPTPCSRCASKLRDETGSRRIGLLRAQTDVLDRTSLRWINAYNPGLSGAWMLQVLHLPPANSPCQDGSFGAIHIC